MLSCDSCEMTVLGIIINIETEYERLAKLAIYIRNVIQEIISDDILDHQSSVHEENSPESDVDLLSSAKQPSYRSLSWSHKTTRRQVCFLVLQHSCEACMEFYFAKYSYMLRNHQNDIFFFFLNCSIVNNSCRGHNTYFYRKSCIKSV